MKKLIALILSCAVVFSIGACGRVEEEFDKNKTQIFVQLFNGGMGTDWIQDAKNTFNGNNDKYEVVLRYKKEMSATILPSIEGGNPQADIYFNTDLNYQAGIYKDLLLDLSDVLDMKVDGTEKTIGEKVDDLDSWLKISSKYGEGCYMLPYSLGIIGFVYDHDMFVNNGWLSPADQSDEAALTAQGITFSRNPNGKLEFVSADSYVNYTQGDIILKAGKDGKFGTYDDGQPKTEAEFSAMLDEISYGNKNASTFIYTGMYDHYSNGLAYAAMAQYMGEDMFKSYFSYDTNGQSMPMYDGSSKPISLDNGFDVFKSAGVYNGLKFIDTYLNSGNIDSNSLKTSSFSHTDAQNVFLLGGQKTTGFPAILVEGAWWENEARQMFKNLRADRQFGKVDYRYMLLPDIDGQAEDKTTFAAWEVGSVVAVKTKDTVKADKIKEFLSLIYTDENMINFTKSTGVPMAFNYTLTPADIEEMTPFARNGWQIYSDLQNINVVKPAILKASDPLSYTSSISTEIIPIKTGATYTLQLLRSMREGVGYQNIMSSIGYSLSEWTGFVNQAKEQGFFK